MNHHTNQRYYEVDGHKFDETDLSSAIYELIGDLDATQWSSVLEICKNLFPLEYGAGINEGIRAGWEPENIDPSVRELYNEDLFYALCDYPLTKETYSYFTDQLSFEQGTTLIQALKHHLLK